MPNWPNFDLYEALEISRTAAAQEIKDSYRRLALIHHPDKNPGDDEATARFQRIGLAHETLANPDLRAEYDNPAAAPQRFPGGGFYNCEDEDDSEEDFNFAYTYFNIEEFFRANFGGARQYQRRSTASQAAYDARCTAAEKERKAEETIRNKRREEKQREKAAARAKRQAEAIAQKAEEERKRKLREIRDEEERVVREQRWASLGATTDAEKQRTCLHVDFWPKEQYQRKFKCDSCRKKRSAMGFTCPHCSLLCCQLCLTKMQANRLEK